MIDKEYQFAGQNAEEKVLEVIRAHWKFFIKPIFKILVLLIILGILFRFFGASSVTSYATYVVLIWVIYIIAINWFRWANTIYLLTNHRIVCVQQVSFFKRVVAEAILENILFMSHKIEGVANTMLNVGSIHIRTSGVSEEEIVMRDIANPYEIQQEITEAQKKYTNRV
ncbi:MAG: hypothetical protein M1338_01890, partial [Patescibacteria group bacterium]|nr:hypothetical protein [Patescibacteria group bacterium]